MLFLLCGFVADLFCVGGENEAVPHCLKSAQASVRKTRRKFSEGGPMGVVLGFMGGILQFGSAVYEDRRRAEEQRSP